jgi:Kef-type K+ transport system membrane component KefB
VSVADLAIVAVLVFGWRTLSARLERFDVTAPITFVLAGLLLTHWPLAFLSVTPSKELIKTLAEFTLALVLFSDASRVGLHELRADSGLYLRLLGAALPVTIGLGTLLAFALDSSAGIWLARLAGGAGRGRCGDGKHGCVLVAGLPRPGPGRHRGVRVQRGAHAQRPGPQDGPGGLPVDR